MRIHFLLYLLVFSFHFGFSQDKTYKPEREKTHNLKHTKLKVDFNFNEKTMNGEAWVTASPYFYRTDKISLDAKTMEIYEVSLNSRKLNYEYDDYKLNITLPKVYQKDEEFTIYIKYKSQPEKVKDPITREITSEKGLYFINTNKIEKNKPVQIWTQGETEANSAWFPTIDAPNQKMSQEIYITVPKQYETLSNGELINQKNEGENRTDYWKFDQKHAPYLAFIGVGEFEVIKDRYKNIPVNYYVEKEFAPYAKDIFGLTPEMIGFFSEKLGVEFPWNKYSQIVVRDYVSGAMENTTAVVHGEQAYQRPGQLIDDNIHENTISHEIFHHWFGNLVTAESWANLSLNESFANYGEYLWIEHKYGKTAAEMHLQEQMEMYKNGQNDNKNLVRFDYDFREEMFDLVSYNKGGIILHMLRNYLGDDAFFKGLNTYLNQYKFQDAEVHQLRLVFEELTGKDLNWFFNQWFYGSGHPNIEISYDYNTVRKTVTINLRQIQAKAFQFPFTIDIFEGTKKTRHTFFVDAKETSFTFPFTRQPTFIQSNADNVLLATIYENYNTEDYIFQLRNAENYTHRSNALSKIVGQQENKEVFNAVVDALNDDAYKIRIQALENINLANKYTKTAVIDKIKTMANNDKRTLVQAAAIGTLGKLTDPELKPIFTKALESKSYSVLGKSLIAMYYVDRDLAIKKSEELPDEVRKILATPLTQIFLEEKDEKQLPFIAKNVVTGMFLGNDDATKAIYKKAFDIIAKTENTQAIINISEDMVEKGKQFKAFNFDKVAINFMRKMVQEQEKTEHQNKERNIAIIKNAMAKLL